MYLKFDMRIDKWQIALTYFVSIRGIYLFDNPVTINSNQFVVACDDKKFMSGCDNVAEACPIYSHKYQM